MAGKWVQLLTEIAPGAEQGCSHVQSREGALCQKIFSPVLEEAARSLKVVPTIGPVHNEAEIEQVISSLAREPRGGLFVMPDVFCAGSSRTNHIAGGTIQGAGGLAAISLC